MATSQLSFQIAAHQLGLSGGPSAFHVLSRQTRFPCLKLQLFENEGKSNILFGVTGLTVFITSMNAQPREVPNIYQAAHLGLVGLIVPL